MAWWSALSAQTKAVRACIIAALGLPRSWLALASMPEVMPASR